MNLKLVAIVLAIVMAVSYIPTSALSDTVALSVASNSDAIPEIRLEYDEDLEAYTFVSKYMEDVFGITGNGPSDVVDPLGIQAVGVKPQEFEYLSTVLRTYDTGSTGFQSEQMPPVSGTHVVGFSAALSVGYEAVSPYEDSNLMSDWSCYLSITSESTNAGHIILTICKDGMFTTIDLDELFDRAPYSNFTAEELDRLSSIQAANLFRFAVGDYDGDHADEIGLILGDYVYVLKLNPDLRSIDVMTRELLPDDTLYANVFDVDDMFFPAHIIAGDLDMDGKDEFYFAYSTYRNGEPGYYEQTYIGTLSYIGKDNDLISADPMRLYDPYGSGEMMDSLMTSVAFGDVDGDSELELVVGGYLWDNDTKDGIAKSSGELYILFYEHKDSTLDWEKGMTVLREEDGNATTRFDRDDDRFDDHFELNDHDPDDTSIYLSDDTGNISGLCRSVNWSNWTIPMATVSLSGYVDGGADVPIQKDQVFFDQWVYEFVDDGDDGYFRVYEKLDHNTGRVPMDNNVVCDGIYSGIVMTNTPDEVKGYEDLALDIYMELYDGSQSMYMTVYSGTSDGIRTTQSWDMETPYLYEFDDDDIPSNRIFDDTHTELFISSHADAWGVTLGNYDSDTYFLKLHSHVFMYMDPTVIAVLDPIPYDESIAGVLLPGTDAFGSTSFTEYDSSGDETSSSVSVDLGSTSHLGKWVETNVVAVNSSDESWSDSHTVTFSREYASPNGTVALMVVPLDLYMYEVMAPDDDSDDPMAFKVYGDYVWFSSEPVSTMLGFEEYTDFITDYNAMLRAFDPSMHGVDAADLDMELMGDLSKYTYDPYSPLHIIDGLVAIGSGPARNVTTSIDSSDTHTESVSSGYSNTIELIAGTSLISTGVTYTASKVDGEAHTDISGMVFSNTTSSGYESIYLGETSEAAHVVDQYSVRYSMWANTDWVYAGDEVQEFIHIGYTVESYTTAPTIGKVIVNGYKVGEDDPYDPTRDSITMDVVIPSTDNVMIGERYELQMKLYGEWYPMSILVTEGVTSSILVTEGVWEQTDAVFVPTDTERTYKVRVEGLSNFLSPQFEFRVDAITDSDGEMWHNPSLAVTGYKDMHSHSEAPTVVQGRHMDPDHDLAILHPGHDIVLDPDQLAGLRGQVMIMVETGLSPGDRVNVWLDGPDGYQTISIGLTVTNEGDVLFSYDADPGSEPRIDATTGILFVLLVVGAGLAVACAYRKY